MGENISNTRWTQLLVPLEILISKISLKYIPIHIYNFEHSRVIMNMKLSSHGFLFHRNINRRENKVQIPLIIHHSEKNKRIYFWCAAKDNWASQISEVALRKELEQGKFPFPPSGQYLRISNQHKMLWICLEEDMCLYHPNAQWGGEFEWPKMKYTAVFLMLWAYISAGAPGHLV